MIDHRSDDYTGRDHYTEFNPAEGDPDRVSHDAWMALQANASQLHRTLALGSEVWTDYDHAGQFFAATPLEGGFYGALVVYMPHVTTVSGARRIGQRGAANDGPLLRRG